MERFILNWKRFKERFLGVDAALVVLGILLFSVAMYFFMQSDGLIEVDTTSKTAVVGKISAVKNNVRRRTQSGFVWSSVSSQDPVFEADSIFTDDAADASIDLQNGNMIKIDPKSLVVIKTRNQSVQLDLRYGSLTGKVSKETPLVISQNGDLQELSGENAEIRIESVGPTKETKIRVIKGEIKLKKVKMALKKIKEPVEPETEQTIKENEVAEFKTDAATAVIVRDGAKLIAPENGKILWLTLGQQIEFKWRLLGQDTLKANLEFSSDPFFAKNSQTYLVDGSSLRIESEKLPNGVIYWRATSATGGAPSLPFRFTNYLDIPPLTVFPKDKEEFAFSPVNGETGKQVSMSWEDKAGSSSFEVQLAKDHDFRQVITKKTVALSTDTSPLLAAGTYFWRIRGLHNERKNSPWSPTLSFNVGEETLQPETPVLSPVTISYEVPPSVLLRVPSNESMEGRGLVPENLPPFTWNSAKHAYSYEVEIAPTDTFANAIKHPLGGDLKFSPQEVKPGPMFVRVRAKSKIGLLSQPSVTGRLDVTLPAPLLHPIKPETQTYLSEYELNRGQHTFQLLWSPRPFASSYELNWGATSDFSKSKKFRLKGTGREISVTRPGDYFARIRAMGANGEPLGPYSQTQVANYRKELAPPPVIAAIKSAKPDPPPPPAPAISKPNAPARTAASSAGFAAPQPLDPKRSSSFVSLDDSTPFVSFRWKAVQGAKQYQIEVATDADFQSRVMKHDTSRMYYTVTKNLPEGRVFWRVRAINKNNEPSDWSEVFDLIVLYQ
jgi:hypothetical protein